MPDINEVINFIGQLKVSELSAVEKERELKDFLGVKKGQANKQEDRIAKESSESLIGLTDFKPVTTK